MTYEEASQTYNGPIPDNIRRTFIYGSHEAYYRAFLITAERNFMQRFRDILRSLCVWRQYSAYPENLREKMLLQLSTALYQARLSAIESWDLLHPKSSASAVMALPIKTV